MRVPAVTTWLSPADVGRRVTVRAQMPRGLVDTVGELEDWDDAPFGILTIRKRTDERVLVGAERIVAGRVVAPAISALTLQAISEAAWPTDDHEYLGDWLLRYSGGEARRTNSVRLAGRPNASLGAALDYVREWYAARGNQALVQSPDPGAFDEPLLDAGWEPFSESYFMVRSLPRDLPTPGGAVHVTDVPSNGWLEVAAPDMARGLYDPMMRPQRQRFVSVLEAGEPVAIGRVVAQDRWGVVTSVRTHPEHRHEGFGRVAMAAIDQAAQSLGVEHLMLQVLVDNPIAATMYEKLGYSVHHRYRYFIAPD